jgi:hypothetical protein
LHYGAVNADLPAVALDGDDDLLGGSRLLGHGPEPGIGRGQGPELGV